MSQPNELLGMPRWMMVAIALPGLLLFVGVMGFALHAGLAEIAPWLPGWGKLAIAVLVPCQIVLGVGLFGALHDHPQTHELALRVAKWARLFGYFVMAGVIAWRLGLI